MSISGARVNASSKSHAEPDASGLRGRGADLTVSVFGGCCGTDHRHIDAMAAALQA
jgi:methionine synthase I (cobalamin-dependent)